MRIELDLKATCLSFLYEQVSKGNVPQIRKGMVEDLVAFVESVRASEQVQQAAKRMVMDYGPVEKDSTNE